MKYFSDQWRKAKSIATKKNWQSKFAARHRLMVR